MRFVCPICHAPLPNDEQRAVVCPGCARQFPERDGALDFTPNPPPDEDVRGRWPLWEQLQNNFLVAAAEIPEHSLSLGARPDALAFAEFADLRGAVLDIGCGPQREPSYALAADGRFVGIDPVRGERERSFAFVQGLGEYLPFPDVSFDRVLFATSLDHMLSPVRALAQARRVLQPSGTVNIWFGEILEPAGEPAAVPTWRRLVRAALHPRRAARMLRTRLRPAPQPVAPAYLDTLEVPQGAIDLFHVIHLSRPLVSEWLDQAGLTVTAVKQYGTSVFLRAERR